MTNPWLPHWGDPAVRMDRGWLWPTEAEILAAKMQPTRKGTVVMQKYFPTRKNDQIPWIANFAAKLTGYETVLGLPTAHVDACVASCKFLIYVLESWQAEARSFGPAATSAVDLLCYGSGPTALVLPTFTAPALPANVASVPPGVLTRLFDLVQIIKNSAGYTDAIGEDLGIVAPATATPAVAAREAPVIKAKLVDGAENQAVNLGFLKNGHMGVLIESQRGEGAMEFLAIDTEVPYHDDRPLQAAGVPEVRQYRMRYWDKGTPNGDWSATLTVTVGP